MARVRCPECGIPTIEDKENLSREEMLCDLCMAAEEEKKEEV